MEGAGDIEQEWREDGGGEQLVVESLVLTLVELVGEDDCWGNLTSMSSSDELSTELLSIKPESLSSSSSNRSLSSVSSSIASSLSSNSLLLLSVVLLLSSM